jgi:hypothetical protein
MAVAQRNSNMDLDGSLATNLRSAIASAARLRGHPVHKDTLEFWQELLAYARSRKRVATGNQAEVESLVAKLQSELSSRHD